MVIARQHEADLEKTVRLPLELLEEVEEQRRVRMLEVVGAPFDLGL